MGIAAGGQPFLKSRHCRTWIRSPGRHSSEKNRSPLPGWASKTIRSTCKGNGGTLITFATGTRPGAPRSSNAIAGGGHVLTVAGESVQMRQAGFASGASPASADQDERGMAQLKPASVRERCARIYFAARTGLLVSQERLSDPRGRSKGDQDVLHRRRGATR